ncbi:hypothetical protein LMH77_11005 [Vibrio lentus]|uniref:hypothetical protein n=1 Tax=Vibrio lentus TaxID=136468 RepID=UPI000C84F036|nr:hypothetical protein [Vibrio lentus]MCC4783430.1 hypothetical protein [Vibrio lentus]PMJ08966.1 hypothetical protein BCU31_17340 [Vibrio lentus]TKG18578.1 hypothetical protein FCW05_11060 [Vibrio lentus]
MLKTISLLLVCLSSLPVLATEASNAQAIAPVPAQQASTNYEKALKDTEELKKKLQEAQTNNEQLQRDNTSLKQENNALKQNLQIQLDVMAGNLKALEERTANTPTNESFDILATSFYERLRSTDDSVSFWGIVSGLIALLITVILASLALFHFGKIREIENNAESVLAQSQRETRMAVNEAINTSRKEAINITHKWVQEEGAKELTTYIDDLYKELNTVSDSITFLKNNEKIAIESTQNIQKKEKILALSLPSNTNSNNIEHKVDVNFPPTQLANNEYELVRNSCATEPCGTTTRLINDIINKKQEPNISLLTFKLFCYSNDQQHNRAISFYEQELFSYYDAKGIEHLNKVAVLSSLSSSYLCMENYHSAYQTTNKAIDDVIEFGNFIFRSHHLIWIHYESAVAMNINSEEHIEKYKNILELNGPEFDEISKEFIIRTIFIAQMYFRNTDNESLIAFVNEASTLYFYLNRTISISHTLLKLGKNEDCLNITNLVSSALLKRQKKVSWHDYMILQLNRATALNRTGNHRAARHLAKYIDFKVNQEKTLALDHYGHAELKDILTTK